MITLKSPREIEQMREAGRMVARAHQRVRQMLQPGVTTARIDAEVERLFAEQNADPLFKGAPGAVPFPAVTCISVNDQVVHGIPGERRLQEGDIVSVDTGCRLHGWCGDAAWTYPVGEVDAEKQRLLAVGQTVLDLAIRNLGCKRYWSEVADLMSQEVARAKFSCVEDFVGHGIGREMHEDPQVPGYHGPDTLEHDFPLQPGLVLAIEPMVNAGSGEVCLTEDEWTIVTADGRPSVHFEHTVALTDDGPLVLTAGVGEPAGP